MSTKTVRVRIDENFEKAWSVLTDDKMDLIRLIRDRKPKSMTELARMAKRNFKHVYADVLRFENG